MLQVIFGKKSISVVVASLLLLIVIPGLTQAKSANNPNIHLQYASFDPLNGDPTIPTVKRVSAVGNGVKIYLLQFSGPVEEEWKVAVEQAGVRLYDYIPDYAFIARMDESARLRALALPFVRWIGLYHPAYRISQALQGLSHAEFASAPLVLSIQTLPDTDLEALASQVKQLGGVVISKSLAVSAGYMRVSLPGDQVDALAAQDGVLWVEPYFEPSVFNDVSGGSIMQASAIRATTGLYGSGQIVGVSDSGLDVGTTASAMSDDFEGRILAGQALCSLVGGRSTWSDLNAHGTHVSGSVMGNGMLSGSIPGSHTYDGSYAGVAPEAQIIMQSLDDDGDGGLECVPNNLITDIFGSAYVLGARLHTNSWGGPSGGLENPFGGYTSQTQQVDNAAWIYGDMLILYAAGNDGTDANSDGSIDPDSIGNPGTAKNVLTIGATENERPSINLTWGGGWPLDFHTDPILSDLVADNAGGMATFSSRGPTDDGRIKPELVAPGTYIISARSHDPSANVGWGLVNDDYIYMGGSSMATPLTAGAATLVREWLTTVKGFTAPSAALMKAVLINGAVDISPGQYFNPQEVPAQRPNNVSGWGRVSLVGSLAPPSPLMNYLEDNTSGLSTGDSVTYTLQIEDSSTTMAFKQVANALDPSPTGLRTPDLPPENTPEPVTLQPRPVELKLDGRPVNQSGKDQVMTLDATQAEVALVLDDGGYEWVFGVSTSDSTKASQFIWFNQFTPDPSDFPFDLEEVWVLFDDGGGSFNVSMGDAIDIVIYEDADGDPTNGASLLATFSGSIAVVDGTTWSQYSLSSPVQVKGPGDVYIAVINRYANVGTTAMSWPAALDSTTNSDRAWVGWWNSLLPNPANLPTDSTLNLISNSIPEGGNWLIRGYGQTGIPMRVTLVWTDFPGNPTAAKALVNDLDLEVIAPDGTHFYGNAGVYSLGDDCLRGVQWDTCNNVEGVIIPVAAVGTYTLLVHGANIPNGPQPFAFVASGENIDSASVPPTETTTPTGSNTPTPTVSNTPTPTFTPTFTYTPSPTLTPPSGSVFLPMAMLNETAYFVGPWEQEDNDTATQANGPLRPGQDYYGYADDEYDFFYFKTEKTGLITVDLSNHSGENVQLQLFYQTATVENRLITIFKAPYAIELPDQPPGKYYVYIFTKAGFNSETSYTLRVGYP